MQKSNFSFLREQREKEKRKTILGTKNVS